MVLGSRHTSIAQARYHFCAVLVMVLVTVLFWNYHHTIRKEWQGVPHTPSYNNVMISHLGDQQLSYRWISLMVQNFGDTGGDTVSLKEFDYEKLSKWLRLSTRLDPLSNYTPNLAAYYYGAVDDKQQLRYIVDYLAEVGQSAERGKWRWLAQAVFLARFKLDDQDLALDLAYNLAALDGPNLPIWTDQMPAFVLAKVGEEKAALDIMMTIMATDKTLQQNEINYMCWYMRDKLSLSQDALNANELYQAYCAGRDF